MLKCNGCTRFTWGSRCRVGDERKDCPSNGDETKCELYPERRREAQERWEAELSRRIPAVWYDFEKQKPVHGDCVLGLSSDGEMRVYQYSDEWPSCLMQYGGNIKIFDITHWMPLPQLPAEVYAEWKGI